jgi:type VI secretion system protein ImpK
MSHEPGFLALCFQEPLTAIVRLRAGRQFVADPEQFRDQMRHALQTAARDARDSGGYATGDIRSATFAVVAFLDESILNSQIPAFADWVRKPLQEELFGTHVAGEVFFDNLRELLGRPDSNAVADVLEVYCLCLVLGFAGRYTGGRRAELNGIVAQLRERIGRIRPGSGDLSASWKPDSAILPAQRDPWIRRLACVAIAFACIALALWSVYHYSLQSTLAQARTLAGVTH